MDGPKRRGDSSTSISFTPNSELLCRRWRRRTDMALSRSTRAWRSTKAWNTTFRSRHLLRDGLSGGVSPSVGGVVARSFASLVDEERTDWTPDEVKRLPPRMQTLRAYRFMMKAQQRAFKDDIPMQIRAWKEIRGKFEANREPASGFNISEAINDAYDAGNFLLRCVQQVERTPDDKYVVRARKEHVIEDQEVLDSMTEAQQISPEQPQQQTDQNPQ